MTYVPPPNAPNPGPMHNPAGAPPPPPQQGFGAPPAPTPTTLSQDWLAATFGALMVLGGGMLLMFGWVLMGFFGLIVGAGLAFWWAYWWRNKHKAFFPTHLEGKSVGGFTVLVGMITLFFVSTLIS